MEKIEETAMRIDAGIKAAPIVRLGDCIEQCNERNRDGALTVDDVRGISTSKELIDTKANMDGVPLSGYKIVKHREFVYVADTSRRGEKVALAFNSDDKSILVSSIYTAFRSKDEKVLVPEFLFLLLKRPEFDRYARFNSWGSARETFDFSELCRVQIPVPSLEVQQHIVDVAKCLGDVKKCAAETRELMKELCPALVSDGVKTRLGTVLAPYEHFYAWRRARPR